MGPAVMSQLIDRSFREKIVLVGVGLPGVSDEEVNAGLDELAQLVDTAGADVKARLVQHRDNPDPATYLGKGKAEELHLLSEEVDADTVVFDNELSPAQQRNLERILGRTAIDRTAVILDIFAQNARTAAGRDQVELALLQYRLPRLRGRRQGLDQQRGGLLGNRGPGETQLEVDRRRMLMRISRLKSNLAGLHKVRVNQRKARGRQGNRSVSLVGYTNAGKSTLLNTLTDAGVLAENRLFATLDPRTRRFDLPGGETILLSDTVGFVKNLPHNLVEAFRSTLEVVAEADLLVHVVDGSAGDPAAQMDAVHKVLTEIEADQVPELVVFNKMDLADPAVQRLASAMPGAALCSALTGSGVDQVVRAIGDRLRAQEVVVEYRVPYTKGEVLAALKTEGEVVSEAFDGEGATLRVRIDNQGRGRHRQFEVGQEYEGE